MIQSGPGIIRGALKDRTFPERQDLKKSNSVAGFEEVNCPCVRGLLKGVM